MVSCQLAFGTCEDFSENGMLATAMRVVNAIPSVHAAPPGLVSSLDLRLTPPRGAFATPAG